MEEGTASEITQTELTGRGPRGSTAMGWALFVRSVARGVQVSVSEFKTVCTRQVGGVSLVIASTWGGGGSWSRED